MTSDFLRPVGALLACLTASCLPIPNKVRDTPPLQGSLTLDGVPLANTALRVEPVKGDFSVPPIPCGISGRLAVTDSAGVFNALAAVTFHPVWAVLPSYGGM